MGGGLFFLVKTDYLISFSAIKSPTSCIDSYPGLPIKLRIRSGVSFSTLEIPIIVYTLGVSGSFETSNSLGHDKTPKGLSIHKLLSGCVTYCDMSEKDNVLISSSIMI
jgi:hypothetical protein